VSFGFAKRTGQCGFIERMLGNRRRELGGGIFIERSKRDRSMRPRPIEQPRRPRSRSSAWAW
jgi:hypothetical protein